MHYKQIINGYLIAIGINKENNDCIDITEDEYNMLYALIANKPAAPDATHEYWITEDGEYELVEVEPLPESDEISADEAWDIITGVSE